ncbi:uncharacterized protein LOC130451101 [Diorhabda sublineata]|uniref:uncharacterized protein LOC130451101 n=1 Tax=Diorhabda sublineata TaxID=1163346 RepID=UPI0024E12666|nr:uncharacterized protein LOC130451101 [Diorhabda sublineata]
MPEFHLETEKPILSLINYVADNVRSLCKLETTESLAKVTADRYGLNNNIKIGMEYCDTKIFGKTRSYYKQFLEPKNTKSFMEGDSLIIGQNRKAFGGISRSVSSIQQAASKITNRH